MLMAGFLRTTLGAGVAILCFSAVFASMARAEGKPDYSRSGFYLGAEFGIARATMLEDDLDEFWDAKVYETGFVNARLGYQVIPYLAAELQVEYVMKFRTEIDRQKAWTHDVVALTANAKVPLSRGRLQPFLLAGGGMFHAMFDGDPGPGITRPTDGTGFALRMGGGLDLFATEHILVDVAVTYVLPFGDVRDLDYISVGFGAQYRF